MTRIASAVVAAAALSLAAAGGVDADGIQRVVRENVHQIKFCHEKALQAHPRLKGKVVIRFTISASGKVISSKVAESTVSDVKLERCIAAQVARWAFPRPGDGEAVVITYPFIFGPTPAGERDRFVDEVLSAKSGWMRTTKRSVLSSPECLGKQCNLRSEVSNLCSAFGAARERIDSGSNHRNAVEPILNAARTLCCDETVKMLDALDDVEDSGKYATWCAVAKGTMDGDAGAHGRCGWARCEAFEQFWSRFRKQPDSWFDEKR